MKRRYITLIAVVMLTPIALAQEEEADSQPPAVGPVRLDLNTRFGDQGQRATFSKPESGGSLTVDVAVSEGGEKRSGFDLVVLYDASQAALEMAEAVDLFEGAFLMSTQSSGRLGLTGLLLETQTSDRAGSVARITFTILDTVESQIALESAMLGTALKIDTLQIGTESAVVTIGTELPTAVLDKPDFDGDGSVGFLDFIIFAGGFGASAGEQSFNAALDLDQSGDVGFSDFLIFAQAFGT